MSGKINFGIDFLHVMLETNARSREDSGNALSLARVLLILEWGLNTEEQDEANKLFWKQVNEESLGDFSDAAKRLIEHVKSIPEAKSKLLTDMILVTRLDHHLSDEEWELVQTLGNILDFRPSEIGKLADRAHDILIAFTWFAKNNSFQEKK